MFEVTDKTPTSKASHTQRRKWLKKSCIMKV